MSQAIEQMPTEFSEVKNEFDYRPVPPLATTTAVLGGMSIFAMLTEFLLPLAVLGLMTGVIAALQIARSRGEYSGTGVVKVGMALCVAFLVAGSVYHYQVYQNELPEGYTRVSFVKDIARKGFAVHEGRDDYHPEVKALDGQKVFLKGYMYPDGREEGIRQFILCKDSGECCFGGKPALTDMIYIMVRDDVPAATYFDGMVSIAGKFVLGDLRRAGELKPAYMIEATHFGVARKLY